MAMRRNRRGGSSAHEFGGSGEDSFVAVVVTKLTGALLFILLLTMVIMALIPKAMDESEKSGAEHHAPPVLAIATPPTLPEAIAGRPYALALAATGGRGPLHWRIDGDLPAGLHFEPDTGRIEGTPSKGTPAPIELTVHVTDNESQAAAATRMLVYESDAPLTVPSRWKPTLPPVPWRAWMERGFGFLVLLLVHAVGMNGLRSLERWALGSTEQTDPDRAQVERRFVAYRVTLRLVSLAAASGLAAWLAWPRA
jgi:hypothetical protein